MASLLELPWTWPLGFLSSIALALLTAHLLYNKFRPGLWDIPGPRLAAYTPLWRLWDVIKGSAQVHAVELHRKHGKLVRIAPNVVSVGDGEAIPTIYNIKGTFIKSQFYPMQSVVWKGQLLKNLFSDTDENSHRELKRKVAHEFTLENVLKNEAAIDECLKLFMLRMEDFVATVNGFDLGAWLQYYPFDVIGNLTFGEDFGFLKQGKDVDGIIDFGQKAWTYASMAGQIPEMHKFLLGNPLLPIIYPKLEHFNSVLNFTLKALDKRTTFAPDGSIQLKSTTSTPSTSQTDMLTRFAATKSTDSIKLSPTDIITQTSDNILAGSETTAIALRAILYYLIKHPSAKLKLFSEIDTANTSSLLSDPVQDREVREHLPYLNAVIKESQRLHPSQGLLFERVTPPSGAVICGRHIPAGTIVGINAFVVNRDPEVFPDPETFLPERWMTDDKEVLKRMERYFFTYGAGGRACIGRYIALVEIRKLVAQFLRRFDVEIVPGGAEWTVRNVWFVQQKMPLCVLKRRQV